MIFRGAFQTQPFCDSVIVISRDIENKCDIKTGGIGECLPGLYGISLGVPKGAGDKCSLSFRTAACLESGPSYAALLKKLLEENILKSLQMELAL